MASGEIALYVWPFADTFHIIFDGSPLSENIIIWFAIAFCASGWIWPYCMPALFRVVELKFGCMPEAYKKIYAININSTKASR